MPKIKKVYMRKNEVRELPAWYQQVEYIGSSWTQKINTGYTTNSNIKVEAEFATTSSSSTDDVLFWTTYSTWTWADCLVFRWNSDWKFEWWASWWHTPFYWFTKNKKHTITYTLTSVTLDWETHTYSGTSAWNTLTIFYSNWRWWYTKVYSFKVYTWDTLVRDFVPCYRTNDNVIWLYDLANNQFYTNSWTWTFSKWPNITSSKQYQIWPKQNIYTFDFQNDWQLWWTFTWGSHMYYWYEAWQWMYSRMQYSWYNEELRVVPPSDIFDWKKLKRVRIWMYRNNRNWMWIWDKNWWGPTWCMIYQRSDSDTTLVWLWWKYMWLTLNSNTNINSTKTWDFLFDINIWDWVIKWTIWWQSYSISDWNWVLWLQQNWSYWNFCLHVSNWWVTSNCYFRKVEITTE